MSALSEKRDVECRKFKETLTGRAEGNLEPSLSEEEGAETRHGTPKGQTHGEGIVQTTNIFGGESHSGTKIPWPEKAVRVRFPPEAQQDFVSC